MGSNLIIQAKLVLLGDLGAGKTSIVVPFAKGLYYECQGVDDRPRAFFSQVLALDEATVKLDVWDTAGQERYHSLAPMYYRGAAAAIVVFDISSTYRLVHPREEMGRRALEARESTSRDGLSRQQDRFRTEEAGWNTGQEAMEYAEANGLFFIETSVKTAQNCSELFYELDWSRYCRDDPARQPEWRRRRQPALLLLRLTLYLQLLLLRA
ncbi:hypothetical protein ACP70R_043555 [Stipagrostis hirtigluma subsp. patula]